MTSLRISTPQKEGVYQASKWLKMQMLLSPEELTDLFKTIEPFEIYPLTGVLQSENIPVPKETFLGEYKGWIEGLKRGVVPTDAALRSVLACAFSMDSDAFWLQEVMGKGYIMKMDAPVVQVQAHSFAYSHIDGVFRPMVFGESSVFWGLQFAYPQVYQNSKTMEIAKVDGSFINTKLFNAIRKWSRDATRPTPFIAENVKVHSPIRLGKECFSWIAKHPDLLARKIEVEAAHAS